MTVKLATYRKRADKVQAVQYTRKNAVDILEILATWGFKSVKPTAHGVTVKLGVTELSLKEGDYIVRDSFGKVSKVRPDRFEASYELEKI